MVASFVTNARFLVELLHNTVRWRNNLYLFTIWKLAGSGIITFVRIASKHHLFPTPSSGKMLCRNFAKCWWWFARLAFCAIEWRIFRTNFVFNFERNYVAESINKVRTAAAATAYERQPGSRIDIEINYISIHYVEISMENVKISSTNNLIEWITMPFAFSPFGCIYAGKTRAERGYQRRGGESKTEVMHEWIHWNSTHTIIQSKYSIQALDFNENLAKATGSLYGGDGDRGAALPCHSRQYIYTF